MNELRRKKILITDDDPAIIELLQVNLEMEGYDVVTAANGCEAVEKAASREPRPGDPGHHDAQDGRVDRPGGAAQVAEDRRTCR